MPAWLEQCINPVCRMPYQVERFSKAFGHDSEIGLVICPFCLTRRHANPLQAFRTRQLPSHIEEWVTWVSS